MNKEFIKKMIKAKQLECEAIMELVPDCVKEKLEEARKDIFEVVKEVVVDCYIGQNEGTASSEEKKTKKVKVEFN